MREQNIKIITVIGTRPQYVKLKPLYDYFLDKEVEHIIVDTCQHFSDNVSKVFIEQFDLNIDYRLNIVNVNQVQFIAECMNALQNIFYMEKPDFVMVMGDTNSTFAAALVANKMGITLSHIEAGIRCNDRNRPEEINRILVDELSDIHFVSRKEDIKNVKNPCYVGDFEYYYLNKLEESGRFTNIDRTDDILMTIHRSENCNKKSLEEIFTFISEIKRKIVFPIHHRTKKIIDENKISIPQNIKVVEPFSYFEMIDNMASCFGMITDSGGVIKCSPFFGKKCIIPMKSVEWIDVISKGYGTTKLDTGWFNSPSVERDTNMYYNEDCFAIILDKIIRMAGIK